MGMPSRGRKRPCSQLLVKSSRLQIIHWVDLITRDPGCVLTCLCRQSTRGRRLSWAASSETMEKRKCGARWPAGAHGRPIEFWGHTEYTELPLLGEPMRPLSA
eukprot:1137107-Pelagomonas_calceolata.AAC.10